MKNSCAVRPRMGGFVPVRVAGLLLALVFSSFLSHISSTLYVFDSEKNVTKEYILVQEWFDGSEPFEKPLNGTLLLASTSFSLSSGGNAIVLLQSENGLFEEMRNDVLRYQQEGAVAIVAATTPGESTPSYRHGVQFVFSASRRNIALVLPEAIRFQIKLAFFFKGQEPTA